jgi:ABC-2 type transport system ATP-binding protein
LEQLLEIQIKRAGYTDEKNAIRDINFSLKEGELAGLIGPNGAGKSTTIKAILGLLPVMDGNVVFCGNNKRYAYIPEQPVFYNDLTLWEHLELAASAYNINQVVFQERSSRLLKLFRLDEVEHYLPATFSKGMQQKVMLVIGFLLNADIYIVDEPFMGLDPRAIRDFLILLQQERRRGAGVLMSTHYLDTAEKICDSIILMSEGRLIMKGNLAEIQEICGLPGDSLLDCFNKLLEDSP